MYIYDSLYRKAGFHGLDNLKLLLKTLIVGFGHLVFVCNRDVNDSVT